MYFDTCPRLEQFPASFRQKTVKFGSAIPNDFLDFRAVRYAGPDARCHGGFGNIK